MKNMRRLTAFFLASLLVFGLALPAQAKDAPAQGQGDPWEVETRYPVIIIHGIGQSEVFLYENDNRTKVLGADGKPIQGWPPVIELKDMLPKLIWPLLGSLLLQCDIGLTKALRGVAKEILSVFQMDETGRPAQNMRVEALHRYGGQGSPPTSLAELEPAVREMAYDHIPLQGMSDLIGEDKVYYFAYDSFGNMGDTVDELYQLIRDLAAKHGKVSLIPISLGGTIMNGLMEYHKDIAQYLNNVVFVIAALDGSNIVGDLFTRRLATDNENLYRKLIPSLVNGWAGYLINIALRLLPKRLVMKVLDAVIDGVVGGVVGYSTMIWALLPGEYYDDAVAEWLMEPEMADIKNQVARYRTAQKNSRDNIKALAETPEVNVYAIAEYNFPLYSFVESAGRVSADGLLSVDSAAMGATSVGVNQQLPANYVPINPNCTNSAHNHIDEGRLVDASTGTLPDHTWFFKDQNHERTGRCDVIMNLTLRLSCGKQAQSVYSQSMKEWPQFNYGREGSWLTDNVEEYKNFDTSKIANAADRDEFIAAYNELVRQAGLTVIVPGEREKIETRFTNIMVKIGEWEAPKQPSFWEKAGEKTAWFFSEAFYFAYGPRGFSDPIWRIWCD